MVIWLNALANVSKAHYLIVHFPFALLAAIFLFRSHPIKKTFCQLLLYSSVLLVGTGTGLWIQSEVSFPLWHAVAGVALLSAAFWLNFDFFEKSAAFMACVALVAALTSGLGFSFGASYFRPRSVPIAQLNSTFHKEIRPILERKCVKCHDASLSQNALDLSSLEGILQANKRLPFLVAGNPDKSGIYLAITDSLSSSQHMPRLAGHLSAKEKETVRKWILTEKSFSVGAAEESSSFHDHKHWAFRKFSKPIVPSNSGATEIDRFLASSGWRPQPVTNEVLHRRLALTLTGLPPEPVQETYASLVERYLSSSHLGENLATYWFDLVSYAEGAGFDGNPDGLTANGYRKFVIDSINQDRPFDLFLRDQLAATGDPEKDIRNQRLLQNQLPRHRDPYITMDYRVNSIVSFTLGMEMRCARCHDHRSEPISQKKYYELVNIFSGSLNLRGPLPAGLPIGKSFLDLYEGAANDLETWRKQEADQRLDSEDFGEWLTDTKKGVGLYTSRVFVDHIWRFVFGRGIVKNAGNFGSESTVPTQLDLLNWLTFDFVENHFSVKHLLRRILASEAFQSQMSLAGSPFAPRRLLAENVRDNFLAVANSLNLRWGTKDIDDRFLESEPKEKEPPIPSSFSAGRDLATNRRSIYFRRPRELSGKDAFSKAFGQPTGFESVPQRRAIPDVQEAIFYAKNSFLLGVVQILAKSAPAEKSTLVREAYQKILSRSVSDSELELWMRHFHRDSSAKAVDEFFHALLSSAEFMYIP